ncbi:MAG: AraC family transcriptional regulator [Anaerolineae bacterium]|nr:AraC family transcriptional regulator [Anaerolineae bacterium]
MKYQEYPPHPLLADAVCCFWTSERDLRELQGSIDVLPDTYIEIIFNSGADQIDDGQSTINMPDCYVVGLLDKPFRLLGQSLLKTVAVRFYAWGFYPLVGIDLQREQIIQPLGGEWQVLALEIHDALECDGEQAAINILQEHLLKQAYALQGRTNGVQNLSQVLYQQQGRAKINVVATDEFISQRQLERRFKALIGITPKALSRKLRFQQVRDELSQHPQTDLSTLAQDFGYADQAHLNREFKTFSNRTPGQFAAEMHNIREELRFGVAFTEAK